MILDPQINNSQESITTTRPNDILKAGIFFKTQDNLLTELNPFVKFSINTPTFGIISNRNSG